MEPEFSWDALRSFLAVVRAGRLTVAARQLGVTHSTLSRRIAGLEQALQTPLFHRRPAGYALTDRGQMLVDSAQAMESAAIGAMADIRADRVQLAGVVRVGAPDGFGTVFLAPRLGQLAQAHPGLQLQLVTMPRVFSLSKREADIAISLEAPQEGRLHARRLTDYHLGLYASAAYLAARGPIDTQADLRDQRFVGYIDDLIYTPELDYLPLVAPGMRPAFTSANLIAQLSALRAGCGLGVLPCFMADPEPGLVRVMPQTVSLTRWFWLIVHTDMRDLARIRVTAEFIASQVRANRAQFEPAAR